MHHPKAVIGRLYVPKNDVRRGTIQLELSYKTLSIVQQKYLATTDWMIELVLAHVKKKNTL